jgi:hypothetical protein
LKDTIENRARSRALRLAFERASRLSWREAPSRYLGVFIDRDYEAVCKALKQNLLSRVACRGL